MCCGTGWEWEARLLVHFVQSCLETCLRLRHVTLSISRGFVNSMELKMKNCWWDYVSKEFSHSSSSNPYNNPGKHYSLYHFLEGRKCKHRAVCLIKVRQDVWWRSGSCLWAQHLGGRGRLGLYRRAFLKPFPGSASNNSTSKSKQLLCGKDWWALSLCLWLPHWVLLIKPGAKVYKQLLWAEEFSTELVSGLIHSENVQLGDGMAVCIEL